jgi:hypothetical protein
VIIAEMANELEIDLEPIGDEKLRRSRHSIMRKAFYPFVSGSRPAIDQQLVQQALDAWSWFWIGVEATLVFVLTGLGLVAASEYLAGLQTIAGSLAAATIGLPLMRGQCRLYAVAQVRAILADAARANVVRSAFDDLLERRVRLMRAA